MLVFSEKIFLFYITKITFDENITSNNVSIKFKIMSTNRNVKNSFNLPPPLLPKRLQFWQAFEIKAKYNTNAKSIHN